MSTRRDNHERYSHEAFREITAGLNPARRRQ